MKYGNSEAKKSFILLFYLWYYYYNYHYRGKNSPANAGAIRDVVLIPGWGISPGEGHGNPLQYFCLENFMDREAWGVKAQGSLRVRHDWSNLAYNTVNTVFSQGFWLDQYINNTFKLIYSFIFLVASGIHCSMEDLCGLFSMGCTDSPVVVCRLSCFVATRDFSSPTRDRTCVRCIAKPILYHWATREVPRIHFLCNILRLSKI